MDDPITEMFKHEPLAVGLLHIVGIIAEYRRETTSSLMRVRRATVLINVDHWPLDPAGNEAAIIWGIQASGLDRDQIDLAAAPGADHV